MPDASSTLAVFVDYDNLQPLQKAAGIRDVVNKALVRIPLAAGTDRLKCEVRVYGGWYEGSQITRLAQDVTVELQRDFPTIIRLPHTGRDHVSISTGAELAVALLQEPAHHMFNTYRRKGKPTNVRVEAPTVVGCTDLDCLLPMMKRLLRTGQCPKAGCNVVVGDLVYRHEQKIVDTMLACDLVYAADRGHDRVVLVSGDDDFLPPLRTVLLRGARAVRVHPRSGMQRASFPRGGAELLELEL